MVSRLREHPRAVAAAAIAFAAAALVAVAWAAGFDAVGAAARHWHPGWLVLVLGAHALAYLGYAMAYCAVTEVDQPSLWRVVLAGFGAHTVAGGFGLDTRALGGASGRPRRAVVRVLGLGALEWALLAPAACLCSVILLLGGRTVQGALLWSWAIAVPVGFAVGLSLAGPGVLRRLEGRRGPLRALHDALAGVAVLRGLLAHPVRSRRGWLGMAGYWIADIASFYSALRCFGVRLPADLTIVAYATGYAATRRSLPLGGAGVTEVLMALALKWVGVPLAAAVPPVALYRIVTFVLPAFPALRARAELEPVLRRGERLAASQGR